MEVTSVDDRAALIAAIRADPDDDLRHLVYADWLEETGNPFHVARARLIRAQCESRRRTAEGRERGAVEADTQKLLDRFAWAWGPGHGDVLRFQRVDRGLTRYRLTGLTVAAYAARAEDYHYALAPEACLHVEVNVSNKTDLPQLQAAAFAERVTGLELNFWGYGFTPATLAKLTGKLVGQAAAGPWAGPLSELAFTGAALTAAHVHALAASPHLRTLTRLAVQGVGGDGVTAALADAPPWPAMRSLRLSCEAAPEEAVRRLAAHYPPGVVEGHAA